VSERSLAALLLTNRLVDVPAKPFGAAEYWALVAEIPDPEVLLRAEYRAALVTAGTLSADVGERVGALVDAAGAFAFQRERLEEEGVRLLSTFDAAFPVRLVEHLGAACPAFLTVAGPVDWLQRDGIGVVGSRDAPEQALHVAAAAASTARDHGVPVVSGLARGVDTAAMAGALAAGSPVVGIPSEGLRVAAKSPEIRNRVHAGELCVASPYAPGARFAAATALGRNKLIYALSQVTLVVHAEHGRGGTWSGAEEALRKRYGTVAVWMGEGRGAGNEALVRLGGTPITDIAAVVTAQRRDPPEQNVVSEQPQLF